VSGKPFSTIVEELNNLLTVVAMCTDEIETLGPHAPPLADLRTVVQRGAELTRLLAELRPLSLPPPHDVRHPAVSEVHLTAATILVVDGDHAARRSVLREMDGRGWRIVDASTIEEAFLSLEVVRAVDVVVIDTAATSRRFASLIVDRYPGAAVIYLGGYTDDRPLRDELPKAEVSLVCRPFENAALVSCIDEALARRLRT
jgi:CheY-like chemotaxis protein